MPSTALMLSKLSNPVKHLSGFSGFFTVPSFGVFKSVVHAFLVGDAKSCLNISRETGTRYSKLMYFFNDCFFNDSALLNQSVGQLNNHTKTRTDGSCYLLMDGTQTIKNGSLFEWSDSIWNGEDEDEIITSRGYDNLVILEYSPKKDFRKALGMRRFYHNDRLFETEYYREDFEKKPVTASHLLKEILPITKAGNIVVDGEFVNGFLVEQFEKAHLKFTGRFKKSLLVTYTDKSGKLYKKVSLEKLMEKLACEGVGSWEKARYRNQMVDVFTLNLKVESLQNRIIRIVACRNKDGKVAFIGTNDLSKTAKSIVRVYGYRWEIEVFFKDVKQNLGFGNFKLRSVGANTRWQYLCLLSANILELIKHEDIGTIKGKVGLAPILKCLFKTSRMSLGILVKVLKDAVNGFRLAFNALNSIFGRDYEQNIRKEVKFF